MVTAENFKECGKVGPCLREAGIDLDRAAIAGHGVVKEFGASEHFAEHAIGTGGIRAQFDCTGDEIDRVLRFAVFIDDVAEIDERGHIRGIELKQAFIEAASPDGVFHICAKRGEIEKKVKVTICFFRGTVEQGDGFCLAFHRDQAFGKAGEGADMRRI